MRHIVALLSFLLNIAAATTTSNSDISSSTTTPLVSTSTSTITFPSSTAPVIFPGGGYFIGATDPLITWSNGWKPQDSPCHTPFTSNKTSSPNQWMTYMVPVKASPWIYLDISSDNASFSILINNQEQVVVSNSPQSCQPQQIAGSLRTDISSNITIYVNGSNNAAEGNWSFQFNNFVIGNTSLTANSAGKTELRTGFTVYAVAVLLLSAVVVSFD
ncbi:hypothetical protein M378DRAFT_166877 [Amanita muscaria Koide BX008]|uniref:Uncharacterized protein n=1 Tax=Amanita muscaria (strain Koide BX008) TaxID=946122 RepID=A0A0C2WX80_AMAMK|nr:hypothetical protein M378DRAFT_166877 [Amanita muscaria Koide BX008]